MDSWGPVVDRHGVATLLCPAEGPPLRAPDTVDLVGAALSQHAELVVFPAQRLDPAFFRLRSGVAGEIVQKLVQYRLRLAVVGDISSHLARSPTLRAFVDEANRGRDVWFVTDMSTLDSRLA